MTPQVLTHPAKVFNKLMELIIRLAEHGLIHGDVRAHCQHSWPLRATD